MHVGVEIAVAERLTQEGQQPLGQRVQIVPGIAVPGFADLDAVDPVDCHYPAVGPVLSIPGTVAFGAAHHLGQFRGGGGLAPGGQARAGPALKLAITSRGAAAGSPPGFEMGGSPFVVSTSAPNFFPDPGRTLTATVRPSVVTARWTCAIEAAPTGCSSMLANRLSSGLPKLVSISRRIAAKGHLRQAVLQQQDCPARHHR